MTVNPVSRETTKGWASAQPFCLVGAGRFELPTSRTRTVRATKLRYAPDFRPLGDKGRGESAGA